jgi:hypothetical protein
MAVAPAFFLLARQVRIHFGSVLVPYDVGAIETNGHVLSQQHIADHDTDTVEFAVPQTLGRCIRANEFSAVSASRKYSGVLCQALRR